MARETAQTRVWWRGVQITARQRDAFRWAEKKWQKRYHGLILKPSQGSFVPGYGPSAGTHDKAGACDFSTSHLLVPQRQYMIVCLKDAGQAIWFRPPGWDGADGDEHAHCLDRVTTNMASLAVWQVAQFDARRSGLSSNRVDPTYRPKPAVKWSYPLGMPVAA